MSVRNCESSTILVQTNITEGPLLGIRTVALSASSSGNNATNIDTMWKQDLSDIPFFGRCLAKDGILRTTEEAVTNIARRLESR
ncbi:MAG: hypothetical protein M3115_06270 [Thermoproteota archaeon]|nr:hypothetical protein [Thermoproteota archaeon]